MSDWVKTFSSQPYDRVKDNDVASQIEMEFYDEPKMMRYKWKGKWLI